jgi:hypothetical protein
VGPDRENIPHYHTSKQAAMPPQLQWLRRTFHAFYSEDIPLFFARDGEFHVIVSAAGSMQGDPAGGIWFDAAVQFPFNILRTEFAEATLAKCFDDFMAFIPPDAAGAPLTCLLSEPRVASFPGACLDQGRSPMSVPMARAIARRWKCLAKTHCGLDVKDEWGVASVRTALHQEDHGDPAVNGLPIVPGWFDDRWHPSTAGPRGWVKAKLLELDHGSAPETCDAVCSLAKAQNQHLIARNCCGATRMKHLWQTVEPSLTLRAVDDVDTMTKFAIAWNFW